MWLYVSHFKGSSVDGHLGGLATVTNAAFGKQVLSLLLLPEGKYIEMKSLNHTRILRLAF